MQTNLFQNFVTFVECDRLLHEAESSLHKGQLLIEKVSKSIEHEKDIMQQKKTILGDLHKKVSNYELEGKVLRERERELVKRLDSVSNPKEYMSYQAEIEQIKRSQIQCEDTLFQVWQDYEKLKQDFDLKKPEFDNWLLQHEKIIEDTHASKRGLSQRIDLLQKQCQESEMNVDPELLDRYKNMKKSIPDPAAPVVNNHCGACSFQLSHKEMGLVRKHILITCSNCFRMLYQQQPTNNPNPTTSLGT